MSSRYHQSSKDHRWGRPAIPATAEEWPDEWRTVTYKAYPRLPTIALPNAPSPAADLFRTIERRASRRDFSSKAMDLDALGTVLRFSCGRRSENTFGLPLRVHPSAGGRFPLEIYPLVLRPTSGIAAGVYHYNIAEHALDTLWEHSFTPEEIGLISNYPWVKDAGVLIFLSAIFRRTQMKYGERGYRYILLEAGHIAQNIVLTAEALNLRCSPLVGTNDAHVEDVLNIDGVSESLVYTLALGA